MLCEIPQGFVAGTSKGELVVFEREGRTRRYEQKRIVLSKGEAHPIRALLGLGADERVFALCEDNQLQSVSFAADATKVRVL